MKLRITLIFVLSVVIVSANACLRSVGNLPSPTAGPSTENNLTPTSKPTTQVPMPTLVTRARSTIPESEQVTEVLPTSKPTQVPTVTPVANSDIFTPHCGGEPKAGLPTESSPGKTPGWFRYTNNEYGFSLLFPPDWDLVEDRNYVCLRVQSEPTIILVVGFKRAAEAISISRSGVGAGELITDGKVGFLGQEISKEILRYQNKDKTILYKLHDDATVIPVDALEFSLSLDDFRDNYDAAELSDIIQMTADTIVESFELTQ